VEVQQQLEWEESRRQRAGIAAIAAGVLTLLGGVLAVAIYGDFPDVKDADDLTRAEHFARAAFFDDNSMALLGTSIVTALGALALAEPLLYLFAAAKFRRPEVPNAARVLTVAGAVLVAVGGVAQQVFVNIQAQRWADDKTVANAEEVVEAGGVLAGAIIRQGGIFALGFAFILICLNAMRAGLLTRFMGVLGMIVGGLFVIPIGAPVPVVQAFWLGAIGLLILGRYPGEQPPAWESGKAEPWPSAMELREAAQRERGEEAPEDPREITEGERPAGRQHASSKKRSRKRRR
jgi:hypothetical protein